MPKTVVVTARVPVELKEKIDTLKINTTKVIRSSLEKAVKEQEEQYLKNGCLVEEPYPEELLGMEDIKILELYSENKFSPKTMKYLKKLIGPYKAPVVNKKDIWEKIGRLLMHEQDR